MTLCQRRLAHRPHGLEGLRDLVIQLDPVGHYDERPVPRYPAQDLLGVEHHRQALAGSLGLPEDAASPMPFFPRAKGGRDGIVDAQDLVILRNNLDQTGAALREEREVLDQIEQALRITGAAEHYLERNPPGLVLPLDSLPLEETLPVCRERANSALGGH